MALKKQDEHIETFMGTTYEIGRPETIGQFKSILEQIIKDLPSDDSLKISVVEVRNGELRYLLEEGIPQ